MIRFYSFTQLQNGTLSTASNQPRRASDIYLNQQGRPSVSGTNSAGNAYMAQSASAAYSNQQATQQNLSGASSYYGRQQQQPLYGQQQTRPASTSYYGGQPGQQQQQQLPEEGLPSYDTAVRERKVASIK